MPISIINRIVENVDKFFAICKKKAVKIGNINNVKAIFTEKTFGKGLTGKAYICLLTNR